VRPFRLLLASALFLVLFVTAAVAAHVPAVWRLEANGATVYLFGTIHLLKAGTPWLDPELERIFDASDALVVEAAVDTVDPAKLQERIRALGYYPPDDGLANHLDASTHGRIMTEAEKLGLPTQVLERMRPWLVGLTLTSTLASRKGFLPQFGAEAELLARARRKKKTVLPLETVEEQFEVFAGLSDAAQAALLVRGLDEIAEIEDLFEQMKTAWLGGDLAALDRLLKEGLEDNPELAEALLYARNRRWVPKIEALLEKPGTYFVAVGAAHLVGKDSVIDLLQQDGYRVARR